MDGNRKEDQGENEAVLLRTIAFMPVDSLSVSVDIQKIFNKYCLPSVVVVVHNTRWRILQTQYFM